MTLVRWLRGVNPVVWDALFAVALIGLTWAAGSNHDPITGQDFDALAYLLSAVILLPFVLRRRFTMTALLISTGTHFVYTAAGYHMDLVWWGPLIGLYFVIAYRPRWMGAIGSVLVCTLMTWTGLRWGWVPVPVVVGQNLLIVAAAWLVGSGARAYVERGAKLARLTEQLRREQAGRERRAVAEEQLRIARELHDAVAHHMSVISVQAGLARYVFDTDPPTARTALDTVAAAGRDAQREMRQMLLLLRPHGGIGEDTGDGAPEPPAGGLSRLPGLAARMAAAGLPVTVDTDTDTGTGTGTGPALPAHLDLCAFRVVQEALTNTLKHAGPARASVVVRHGADRLTVRVSDDGRGATAGGEAGHGLIGMRERARLCDGTLDAGPRPGGGFEVTLTLPLDPGIA